VKHKQHEREELNLRISEGSGRYDHFGKSVTDSLLCPTSFRVANMDNGVSINLGCLKTNPQ